MNTISKIKRAYALWIGFVILVPTIVWGAGSALKVVTLAIPSVITVSGPRLWLNDLGTICEGQASAVAVDYLKQVDLGAAPAPGQERVFNRDYLNSILEQFNFPVIIRLQMGETVVVKSSAACIQESDIQKAIQSLYTEKKPHIVKRWVELQNIPGIVNLSPGEWEIKVSVIGNQVEAGNTLFKVVLTKGTESRILNISGKVRATAQVYRAVRDIPYQSVIMPADFELVELELQNGKEFVGEFQSGVRLTKLVKQGEVLHKNWLQPIPLISKNQEVKVVVKDENVAIKIIGIAKIDGWLGDEVMIVNPLSHKTFKARVTGNGIVELNMQ
jgi:flagella basal body P-ring formation protein FlgA